MPVTPDILSIDSKLLDENAEAVTFHETLGECINDLFDMIGNDEMKNVSVCYYVTMDNHYAIYLPEHLRGMEPNHVPVLKRSETK